MDKNVFSFSFTTSSTAGHRSLYLVTPGNTWSHLATLRHNWQHYICPLLVTPGNSWSQIAGYGSKMPKSPTFVKKMASGHSLQHLVTLIARWSHLATCGHTWQHCSYTLMFTHTLQHEPTLGQLYRVFNSSYCVNFDCSLLGHS